MPRSRFDVTLYERVSRFSNFYTAAFPNAGLPNAFGEYDETADDMGKKIKKFLDEGCIILLIGCCGTTPEHIKVISELVKNYKPRKMILSLEVLNIKEDSTLLMLEKELM